MGWTRETEWAQGSFLTGQALSGLKSKAAESSIAIAVSHSCDIANDDLKTEPNVEFILGRRIEKCDGNFSRAKNPRKLHLGTALAGTPMALELLATQKFCISKDRLHPFQPDGRLNPGEVKVLQSWLAARYKRQALPDNLQSRLRHLFKKMDKLGAKHSEAVLGYWLDYEPKDEELQPEEPYEVWISVVHTTEDPSHEEIATQIAEKLKGEGEPDGLDLRQCEAYSEEEFTLRDLREQVQYRVEHLSFRTDPPGPTVQD